MNGKPFIVAEMSANHLSSIDRAKRIIEAAAEAGADAIKLQTWVPELMVADKSIVIPHGPWAGRTLWGLYQECYTPREWHEPLFLYAEACGLEPFSTAFDKPSVDFLETLGVKRHKVSSFEVVDLDLVAHAASKGKPLILSTGMASDTEIRAAVLIACGTPVTVLSCTSAYPASPRGTVDDPLDDQGLWVRWGLSDHTLGTAVSVAAVARGACYIEKHLTLSRSDGGPDAAFSLEPHEFKALVQDCRAAYEAVFLAKDPSEEEPQRMFRRSLWWAKNLPKGHIVVDGDLQSSRPADGLPCSVRSHLPGQYLTMDVKRGTPTSVEQFTSSLERPIITAVRSAS